MAFDNWFEKTKRNRENFIEYYVQRLGEENRQLIIDSFDSMKFCFYINPNDIESWISLKILDDYTVATYQFFNDFASELGIDISKVSLEINKKLNRLTINTNDINIKNKIKNLFRIGGIATSFIPDDYNFDDLYSFRKIEAFLEGEGKEYNNPEEELLHRRLLFLRDMGVITIEGRPIDYYDTEECKEFINSARFKELANKYQDLAETAFNYKKEVDLQYKDLIDYMEKSLSLEQEIIKRYDKLKQDVSDSNKIKEYEKECRREIASLRIICGNFDLSNCLDEEAALEFIIDSKYTQHTFFGSDGVSHQEKVIFFCPFRSYPGYEDVDLRHEIGHGITSSLRIDDNTTTYKIGNKIEKFIDGEQIECQLLNYNEWITQIEAIKETKDAFAKGIYIISEPSLKNRDFIGKTSDYDDYLPLFEIIYDALPQSAKQSQIESSNDSLYKVIPLTQLMYIEELILNGHDYDEELLDKLYKIRDQLTANTKIIGM